MVDRAIMMVKDPQSNSAYQARSLSTNICCPSHYRMDSTGMRHGRGQSLGSNLVRKGHSSKNLVLVGGKKVAIFGIAPMVIGF